MKGCVHCPPSYIRTDVVAWKCGPVLPCIDLVLFILFSATPKDVLVVVLVSDPYHRRRVLRLGSGHCS